jgi:hypothetical protein
MYLIAIAVLVLAVVVWRGRGKTVLTRGEWRAGAGLLAIGTLSAAAILTVRGNVEEALALLVVGGLLLFAARTTRRKVVLRPFTGRRLTAAEARSILGVEPSASDEDIRKAYARLIRRAHPDSGGTDGLAAQLNAARDRLLNRS